MKLNNKYALKCSMNFLYQFERGPHAPPAISDINSQSSLDVLIKHVSYYYTDIYFDISCEGGGGGGYSFFG